MTKSPSEALLKAIAVTAELTGTELSESAAKVMAQDLCAYAEPQVLGALVKCRKELKGRLTVADVIKRLDDGRPGPEEAWAICSIGIQSEGATIVWTREMQSACAVAWAIPDDMIAARMAFKEAYDAAVTRARDAGEPVAWSASLGWSKEGRSAPILQAVEQGRLKAADAMQLLPPSSDAHPRLLALAQQAVKALPG